jgi:hypothetical protein
MIARLEAKDGAGNREDAHQKLAAALSSLESFASLVTDPEDRQALARLSAARDIARLGRRQEPNGVPLLDRIAGHPNASDEGNPEEDVRRVARIIMEILLRDDPHALSAVRRGLTIPRRIDRTNVVHLLPEGARALTSASLFQYFYDDHELFELAEKLAEDKIRTIGDLIKLSPHALRSVYNLSAAAVARIEKLCASFGLWLDMGTLSYRRTAEGG